MPEPQGREGAAFPVPPCSTTRRAGVCGAAQQAARTRRGSPACGHLLPRWVHGKRHRCTLPGTLGFSQLPGAVGPPSWQATLPPPTCQELGVLPAGRQAPGSLPPARNSGFSQLAGKLGSSHLAGTRGSPSWQASLGPPTLQELGVLPAGRQLCPPPPARNSGFSQLAGKLGSSHLAGTRVLLGAVEDSEEGKARTAEDIPGRLTP